MTTLTLKAGKERSLARRHPWVYATAVAKIQGNANPGDTVDVRSSKGDWLARAAYSPESALRARVWTFDPNETIDRNFFERRIHAAIERRRHLRERSSALRLIFGEADGLPGLVVDQYDNWIVVQLQSAGVDFWKAVIFDLLALLTGCVNIYERSDAAVRSREGLPERTGPVAINAESSTSLDIQSPDFAKPVIQEDGVRYQIDIAQGHKTGFYVDQRENRQLVRQLCERLVKQGQAPRLLNCFSYTGGFSLAAVKGGAKEVISVDSSADALRLAAHNATLNQIASEQFICLTANVFEDLKKRQADNDPGFDIIILDPPKFAPSAHHVDKAARAYKDLNMRGMRLLKPGGYLLTFSCSGAISVDLFQKIVAGAVIDAQVNCQLLQRLAAGDDHPMSMVHPEGEYLKGLLLRLE